MMLGLALAAAGGTLTFETKKRKKKYEQQIR
jgi:hypothetical protein